MLTGKRDNHAKNMHVCAFEGVCVCVFQRERKGERESGLSQRIDVI